MEVAPSGPQPSNLSVIEEKLVTEDSKEETISDV